MKILGQVVILLALSGAIGSAQTYSIIYNFTNYSGGLEPKTGLTFNNNVLYGTTSYGGSGGTLFKINPDGSGYLALSSPGGYAFNAGLTMNGSTLYAASGSAIFKVNVDIGNYVDLLSYTGSPLSAFVLNGTNLLATSNQGGSAGWGSIFRINTDGTMSARLYSFSNSPDGARPLAGLVLDGNTLYGTTSSGGNANGGVVFKINLDGTGYTILHHFASYPDGSSPQGDLVLDGNTLYGTTQYGGTGYEGTVFAINTDGTGYAVLHNFYSDMSDGVQPMAALLLRGSTLYGTTGYGGSFSRGTVFAINADGSGYAILKSFAGYPNGDGEHPSTGLVAGNDGLYGTTTTGGLAGHGTIFRLTLPPPPLQIAVAGGAPVVIWQSDGFNHTVQTTTNLQSGKWTTVSNAVPVVGLQITNVAGQPQAFFRLQ